MERLCLGLTQSLGSELSDLVGENKRDPVKSEIQIPWQREQWQIPYAPSDKGKEWGLEGGGMDTINSLQQLRASPTAMSRSQPLPILDLEKQTHVNWGLGDRHANCALEEPAKRVNTGKRCAV